MTGHRPLLWLAVGMAALAGVAIVGMVIDPREVLGAPLWAKPLKFALSIGIYALTLSWLIGQLHRMRRLARIAGTVSVIGLVIEVVIIAGAAALGDTSHFNVSTPLHSVLWSVMALSIVVVWLMTLVVGIALFRNPLGDRARTLAIRAGVIIALVGMGLAFLMTGPTAQQLDDFQGVAGAHAVGVADGGPGLFLLGWSTVAGDLRIPHFVGMHALQVLPIVVITLELLSRRIPRLTSPLVRLRLVRVAVVAYAATVLVLTWQALAGQSIVSPAGAILAAGLTVAAATVVSALASVLVPDRDARSLMDADSAR
ncbi:hypothetical protein GCM10007382_19470 [Salinibacterium xinjiangense]|uniref:Uncharacterized protein n=1 Tax=Salinibacterium xinjiangense TaxID=386302 RepID=A0A2C8YSY0_9MICO|nr:hypothetical protein [Salinibacterium xinjiangense]GGK99517.1 hypothetical protein GCM10007382_19470 [Salinibacterium xinjiangense]SOE53750.1 hypothetical protein SAMN06296378_0601 [Salinibacterium xinjiangense]